MDYGSWLTDVIVEFVMQSPHNDMGFEQRERIFDPPLVGFSSGADPLYEEYKSHIGSFYLTPLELFIGSFAGMKPAAEELTVISWIIPSTGATRSEQAARTRYPSERWARTRDLGEKFNNEIRNHVVAKLAEENIAAVAPMLSPQWSRFSEGPYQPCSNWSERHAAHTAGLGTFGLCDGLITPVGKAVRIGSVIGAVRIPATERPYTDHHAYCLHFTEDICRQCIPRCPVKALSESGHEKQRCMKYTEHTMNRYIREEYGFETYACGLCQCNVPCMDRIPTSDDV